MNAIRYLAHPVGTWIYYAAVFAWFFAVSAWDVLVIGCTTEGDE